MKARISSLERTQVKLGSCTVPGFQLISLVREVADRFSFGVTLGLRLLSPYSLIPLSFMIWLMAKLRSEAVELASRERRHLGCAY